MNGTPSAGAIQLFGGQAIGLIGLGQVAGSNGFANSANAPTDHGLESSITVSQNDILTQPFFGTGRIGHIGSFEKSLVVAEVARLRAAIGLRQTEFGRIRLRKTVHSSKRERIGPRVDPQPASTVLGKPLSIAHGFELV